MFLKRLLESASGIGNREFSGPPGGLLKSRAERRTTPYGPPNEEREAAKA